MFSHSRMTAFLTLCIFAAAGLASAQSDRGKAELDLGDGKKITIDYGRPSTSGAGYKRLTEGKVPEGFFWRMGSNAPTTLETPVDLKFGDKVVKAGKYGLWGKRVGKGWHLAVNSEVAYPAGDEKGDNVIAVIPLESKKADDAELLTIGLAKDGDKGGVFSLAWGPEVGTAKFTVAK